METHSLDAIDAQLLDLLQENARATAVELAEEIGVSDNTIHNRIDQLEAAGVLEGYSAIVNHDATDINLTWLFICTARISDRGTVATNVLTLPGVREVSELMTGQRNLHVKAVGAEKQDATRLAGQLDNLNLEINDEILLRDEHSTQPNYTEINDVDNE